MTKQEIIEMLNRGGYICKSEYNEGPKATLYDEQGAAVKVIPLCIIESVARAEDMTTWRETYGGQYVGHHLRKKYRDYENWAHCRRIATDLEAYAEHRVYKCPDCGEEILIDDEREKHLCSCGFFGKLEEYENLSIYDYLADYLDIEYRCNSRKEYKSVEICVAWGGPGIYVDTADNSVKLYWGGERAEYGLLSDTVEAIDDWAEEYWNCL